MQWAQLPQEHIGAVDAAVRRPLFAVGGLIIPREGWP